MADLKRALRTFLAKKKKPENNITFVSQNVKWFSDVTFNYFPCSILTLGIHNKRGVVLFGFVLFVVFWFFGFFLSRRHWYNKHTIRKCMRMFCPTLVIFNCWILIMIQLLSIASHAFPAPFESRNIFIFVYLLLSPCDTETPVCYGTINVKCGDFKPFLFKDFCLYTDSIDLML